MTTNLAGKRVSFRVSELADHTGLRAPHLYRLIDQGVIPRLSNTGRTVIVPAWAVDAWLATGDWNDPAFRPQRRDVEAEL